MELEHYQEIIKKKVDEAESLDELYNILNTLSDVVLKEYVIHQEKFGA